MLLTFKTHQLEEYYTISNSIYEFKIYKLQMKLDDWNIDYENGYITVGESTRQSKVSKSNKFSDQFDQIKSFDDTTSNHTLSKICHDIIYSSHLVIFSNHILFHGADQLVSYAKSYILGRPVPSRSIFSTGTWNLQGINSSVWFCCVQLQKTFPPFYICHLTDNWIWNANDIHCFILERQNNDSGRRN